MPRIDVHQHLWPESLLEALGRRAAAPRLRRSGAGWVLELAGEPPAVLDLADHDPAARSALLERDGIERALIAPSAPLGIETLPPAEAAPLQEAFNTGILELGDSFALWAALAPGAGPRDVDAASAAPGAPPWWAATTGYVAEISAAWHAWAAWGRPAHPRLTVVWAMLAGGAPLHAERLAARGGPAHAALNDPRSLFDVSSYGARAVDAMLRILHAIAEVNPARLLVPSTLVPA